MQECEAEQDYLCQVSIIMSESISKTKMKASEFRFTRVKGWLGGDQTERIEGWKTFIYEAAGKMKAVNTTKVYIHLPLLILLSKAERNQYFLKSVLSSGSSPVRACSEA